MQEPKKLEKHTISHLKALFRGNFWFKVQTYILRIDCHTSFLQKISLNLTFLKRMQFSSRDGRRWPHLIIYLKLSLYFVLKSIFTFHGHACKWVKLTFYLKMDLFARKTLWLSLSKLHSYPSKSKYLLIRAFKWGIICFCSVSSFCTISIWTKKTENFWSKFWQDLAWKWCWWGPYLPMQHVNCWSEIFQCAIFTFYFVQVQ